MSPLSWWIGLHTVPQSETRRLARACVTRLSAMRNISVALLLALTDAHGPRYELRGDHDAALGLRFAEER
jgi:hypothetical protein